jgi:hypothetical protein
MEFALTTRELPQSRQGRRMVAGRRKPPGPGQPHTIPPAPRGVSDSPRRGSQEGDGMGAGSEGCHPRLMSGTPSGVRLGLGGRKHNDAKAAKAAKAQRINPSVDPTGFTDRPVLPKKSANDPRIGAVPAGTPEDSRVAQAPGPPATPTQPFSPAPEGQRIRPAGAHRGDEMDAGSGGCHPRLMSGTPSGVRWGLGRRKSRQ